MMLLLAATLISGPIARAETAWHGPGTHITSTAVAGNYAVARGSRKGVEIHDGLKRGASGWTVVCRLGKHDSAPAIQRDCGFPQALAHELASAEAANVAAERGDFTTAVQMERDAQTHASPALRAVENARASRLAYLNAQMSAGLMTRDQAMKQWNRLELGFPLP